MATLPDDTSLSALLTLSPGAGRYLREAGRLAGLERQSRVLAATSNSPEAAALLAEEFGCRVTAFDFEPQRLSLARDIAVRRGVADLITFDLVDPESADYPDAFFDLFSAEGGALTYLGRKESLAFARRILRPGGYLAFSDLVYTADEVPAAVRAAFEGDDEEIPRDGSYLALLSAEGFGVIAKELLDRAGWDRYYEAMRQRIAEGFGAFAKESFRRAMADEISAYYDRGGKEAVGYLFGLAKYFG
jgi:SAM-dependent methyltransferase